MKTSKIFFIIAICILSVLLFIFLRVSPAGNSALFGLTPDSQFYFLKAAKENIQLSFTSLPREKMYMRLEFANNRLSEARDLIWEDQDLIQPTLERYIAEVNSLPDQYQEKDQLGLKVRDNLAVHVQTLILMSDEAGSIQARAAIRYVISRLSRREDLSLTSRSNICTFLTKEASSSALNDVEKTVLAKRARNCFEGVKP